MAQYRSKYGSFKKEKEIFRCNGMVGGILDCPVCDGNANSSV